MKEQLGEVFLYALPALGVALVAVLTFGFRMFRIAQRETSERFDEHRLRIERQVAELEKQLVYNSERFRDVNHLLLESQARLQQTLDRPPQRIRNNDFLDQFGISPDLRVDKRKVFVLMPFNPEFEETYDTIRDAATESGFQVARGDSETMSANILQSIVRGIAESNLVIADITGRNPNVFYELGIAHSMGKAVLIISKVVEDIPFNVAQLRVLTYESNRELYHSLRKWIVQTLVLQE